MSNLIIKTGTEEDLPALLEIERACFTPPWSKGLFQFELNSALSNVIVAWEEDTIVGFAIMRYVLDEGELLNIAVSAPWRGKGVASKLFEELFIFSKAKEISRIFLEVRVSNTSALHLYQRLGFTTIGKRKNYYTEPLEDAFVMQCNLEEQEEENN